MPRQVILTPGLCTGFASAKSPLALPKGTMAVLNDVRLGDGTVRLRWSDLPVSSWTAGSTFAGAYECVQNGTSRIFRADANGGVVRVWKSDDHGVTFSEITGSGTRMTGAGPVYFQIVSQRGTDFVLIQNGVDDPRAYDGSSVVTVPQIVGTPVGQAVGFFTAFNYLTAPAITNPSSGHLSATNQTRNGIEFLRIVVSPSVSPSDQIVMQGSTPFFAVPATDLAQRQYVFLFDSPQEDWRSLKIETAISSTGPWVSVLDPTSGPIVTQTSTPDTVELVGHRGVTLAATTNYPYLRVSWADDAPSATTTIDVYGMGIGGVVPGGTNYGAAYSQAGTLATGPGAVFASYYGGPSALGSFDGYPLHLDPLFGYDYYVTILAVAGAYPPRTQVYRNDAGTTGYYFVGVATNVPPGGENSAMYHDPDPSLDPVDYTQPLPYASTGTVPKGTAMASINDRLFVCAGNRFWYSQAANPFAFTQLVQFDANDDAIDTSGGSFTKPGETFQGVVGVGTVLTGAETLGTPQSGSVSVYCLTDLATYVLSGFDALSLNKSTPVCLGTRSPLSVARGQSGGFTFLDSHLQVRRVQGTQSQPISRHLVDDQTSAIPPSRLQWASGATINDRYFLAYTAPSTTANGRILVYNDAYGWESIDLPGTPAQGLLPHYDPTLGRTRLLAFHDAGLVEHDALGQTGPVTARIVFPEGTDGFTTSVVDSFYLMTDPDPTGTANFVANCSAGRRVGAVTYQTISLAPVYTGATRVAKATKKGTGADALTVQPILTVSAKGGTAIYRAEMEADAGSDDFSR